MQNDTTAPPTAATDAASPDLEAFLDPSFMSEFLLNSVVPVVGKLAGAVAILVVGFWLIKRLKRVVGLALDRAGFGMALVSFLSAFLDIALKVFLLIIVAGVVGVDTAALVGVLAAAGFAVGLALQGSLSNFAAGILVLVFKPYQVDDWISVEDQFGRVEAIQIFSTIIVTPGLKTLVVPNAMVIDGILTNFSKKGQVRLELNVTMPYAESYPKVEALIQQVLATTPGVLTDPAPEIGIEAFDSHSIVLAVRPYANPDDYWPVTFEVHRRVKHAFSEAGIEVAYSEGVELGSIGD
ncbi:MAG: mechanosensitive ion channel family protein [Bacteroidota bacterium]